MPNGFATSSLDLLAIFVGSNPAPSDSSSPLDTEETVTLCLTQRESVSPFAITSVTQLSSGKPLISTLESHMIPLRRRALRFPY